MKNRLFFLLAISFFFLKTADSQTTIVLQPGPEGKDAGLWSIMPDVNYGNTPKFVSSGWTHYGEPGINRAIIDFDLTAVPAGAQIVEARLNFYFVCLEPTFFGHTGENEAHLQLITEPWEEDSVTWNTQPATTEEDQVYLPSSTDPYQDYTDIDVTILFQKLFNDPDNFHGLMLKLMNENPYRCLLFASGDYADTVEFRPVLEITYTESPTVTIEIQPGAEGKDAQLWSIMPDVNYGDIPKFDCSGWTHYGVPGVNRGIIDFDLSAIPENAEILDARLNLYFVCLEPTYFGHTGENDAYLQLITDPWEEDSVTWNNQPQTTEEYQVYLPPSTDPYQDYTDIDITRLIQKLQTEPDTYHGIMLRLLNENPYRCLLFASSDYNDTVEFRPRLEITYAGNQMQPVAGFSYIIEDLTVFFQDASLMAEERFWDFGDGYYSDLINPWHTYDLPGEYQVCLTTWNKNGTDTVCKQILLQITAIPESSRHLFSIYPNPAWDQVTVRSDLDSLVEMTAFDFSGRALIKTEIDFGTEEYAIVNIAQLPAGIYFVRLSSGKISETSKIVVIH